MIPMWRMKRATRKRWQTATNLLELGGLTALWLEGYLDSRPGYQPNCGPDDETTPLIPVLAKLCRAGFVTDQSQPGVEPVVGRDGALWCQRAAVFGFVDPDLANVLASRAETAGMIVDVVLAGPIRSCDIAVTTRAAEDFTCFGGRLHKRDIEDLYDDCGDAAIAALQQAAQVTLVDPEWGRVDSPLWPVLDAAADVLAAHNPVRSQP